MPGCTPWNFNDVHSIHVLSQTVWLKETETPVLPTPNFATANNYTCKAGGSHSGITEYLDILGCHCASFSEWLPVIRMNLLTLTNCQVVHLTLGDDTPSKLPVTPASPATWGFCRGVNDVFGVTVFYLAAWTFEDGTDFFSRNVSNIRTDLGRVTCLKSEDFVSASSLPAPCEQLT